MKTIYLVRHGKAESGDPDSNDFKRSLIERGQNDSRTVAGRLKKKKFKKALFISSPAARALQTARICAKELGYLSKNIRTRKSMYDQAAGALLAIVHETPDTYDTLVLFGHDPSFTEFAGFLVKNFTERMPTASVAGVEFKVDAWKEVSQGKGKLILFDFPKDKMTPDAGKPSRKDIEKKLAQAMEDVLKEVDADVAGAVVKALKKSSEKVMKVFVKQSKKAGKKR